MNVQYYKHELDEWVHEKAHNWIIHRAFDTLRNIGYSSALDERYVHYGAWFADYPFIGRPETVDPTSPQGCCEMGARQDLFGCLVAEKANTLGNAWIKIHYPDSTPKWPNLFLQAHLGGEITFIVDRRENFPLDQFGHYPNNGPICIDGTENQDSIVVRGIKGEPGWGVKGFEYAGALYELARRFWPGPYPDPCLDQLRRVSNPGELCIHFKITEYVDLTANATTFLGSNPYITFGTAGPTEDSKPTWPIWVPDSFEPYKLLMNTADRSPRAAAIYLGWALHILQDLCVPFHAREKIGTYHTKSEDELDKWINDGRYSHLPVFEGAYLYSDQPVYHPCIPSIPNYVDMQGKCATVTQYTTSLYDDVHPARRQQDTQSRNAYEYILDIAIKETMDLIRNLEYIEASRRVTVRRDSLWSYVGGDQLIRAIYGMGVYNTPNPYFNLFQLSDDKVVLRAYNGRFIRCLGDGTLIADSACPGETETFTMRANGAIQAYNGLCWYYDSDTTQVLATSDPNSASTFQIHSA